MWIKQNKYALAACVAGIIFVFAAHQWDFDVWEVVGDALNAFDKIKGHEIMFLVIFLTVGYCIDAYKRRKRHRLDMELTDERLQAMKATMTTVHDIVNNALNSLQLFRLEALKHSSFSPDAIHQFDGIIYDTADRLKSIEASEVFVPRQISEDLVGIREH